MDKLDPSDWQRRLSEADTLIRAGQSAKAQVIVQRLAKLKVPRARVEEFSSIARRCNRWEISLGVLKPYIYPKVKSRAVVSDSERIEYALSLQRAGALQESMNILSRTEVRELPAATLGRAFAAMKQWDYGTARKELDEYLKHEAKISEYQAIIARVNRLACLGYEASAEFFDEFECLSPILSSQTYRLLWANSQEILALRLLELGRYKETEERVQQALTMIGRNDGPYALLLQKYERVAQSLMRGSIEELLSFRKEALAAFDWETLRHLDYYATILQPDGHWAKRVFFGTPYAGFRRKLEALRAFSEKDFVVVAGSKEKVFDPWFPGSHEGDLVHRLLVLLLRDWYRPLSVGGIFAALHPEEKFDVDSSFARVRQLLKRATSWLKLIDAPVRFVAPNQLHALRLQAGAKIQVRKCDLVIEKNRFLFSRFADEVQNPLSAQEWATKLNLSKRQTITLLNEAVEAGVIDKMGRGRYCTYALT